MIYLVAGEASGDLHGANLIKAIKSLQASIHIRGAGGNLMQAEGMELVQHYKQRAFMGFTEVLKNLRTIKRCMREIKQDILQHKPSKIVLIDNPGFNLPIAKWASKHGFEVHYYIAPKVWAWNTKRVKKIKKYVHKLYSILPFELEFFNSHAVNVEYVGNPVLDAINAHIWKKSEPKEKTTIALLPGSRKPEIEKMLPIMLDVAKLNTHWDFEIAVAPNFELSDFVHYETENVKAVQGNTYDIIKNADAAIVTSGTATLETALIGTVQLVCYRVSAVTYAIGKQLVKIPYISLVNLILNKNTVAELIQDRCNREDINKELHRILNADIKQEIKADYKKLAEIIGTKNASQIVAKALID